MRQVWLSEGMNTIQDSLPHFKIPKDKKKLMIFSNPVSDNKKDFTF